LPFSVYISFVFFNFPSIFLGFFNTFNSFFLLFSLLRGSNSFHVLCWTLCCNIKSKMNQNILQHCFKLFCATSIIF
jgi:hypothetical protein